MIVLGQYLEQYTISRWYLASIKGYWAYYVPVHYTGVKDESVRKFVSAAPKISLDNLLDNLIVAPWCIIVVIEREAWLYAIGKVTGSITRAHCEYTI